MSTARPMRVGELLRWMWTQLTSMRTALFLLFLLALAAIPGSMVPQRDTSPIELATYKVTHPQLDAFFEPLGLYNVYRSPWFSAIYLLLFVSLAGCIIPRIGVFWRNVRTPPPVLPKYPERIPGACVVTADDDALERAAEFLKGRRYRMRLVSEGISAERGYLREAGNIVFHMGLVAMLIGLGITEAFGYRGSVVVVEGHAFSNVSTQFDDFTGGRLFNPTQLEPFTVTVNRFDAEFETGRVQRGAARRFDAHVTVDHQGHTRDQLLQVNHPLSLPGGTRVNLLGHGYAANVTVTDAHGDVAFSGPVVLLPQDAQFASTGVVKAPDARPQRLAFEAFFFPTAVLDQGGPRSVFPDALAPELYLNAWHGQPKVETGVPENVYTLNTEGLEPVKDGNDRLRIRMQPGQSYTLPNGLGTVTFEGWHRWVKLQVSATPGSTVTLVSVLLAIAGISLSLTIKPRRVFVRIREGRVAVAGLDRTDTASGLDEEITELALAVCGTVSSDDTPDSIEESP